MSFQCSSPLPRLRPDAINRLAAAAGRAPACAYDGSDDWNRALRADARRALRQARLAAVSPSLASLCLAAVLVMM